MFIDEPGLQFIFSSVSGYPDIRAKEDLDRFLAQIERPRGIHLCGNPDWEFLLNRDLDILSMDIYTNGDIFPSSKPASAGFWTGAGSWPGAWSPPFELFSQESAPALIERLEGFWEGLCGGN